MRLPPPDGRHGSASLVGMPDTTAPSYRPIRSDADALAAVETLLQRANQRQCWIIVVADDRHTIHLMMPIEGMPDTVDHDAEDQLADVMAEVVRHFAAAFVLVVWERPGGPDPSRTEWEWIHAVEVGFARAGIVVRGQMLLHDDGVAWLESDESESASVAVPA